MYPSLVLQNQFGEVSNNAVIGGSSQVSCSFIMDSTNGNGLGIRSLKGQGIKNIFAHTSSTPAAGSPNPAAGYFLVEFEDNYAGYQSGTYGSIPAATGTPINVTTGTTQGLAYIVITLGTTTIDQWQKLGWLYADLPAVGAAFIAKATTTATGTGTIEVQVATGSGVGDIQPIGNPNLALNPSAGGGGSMCLVNLVPTNSSTTTLHPGAPADGAVIGLTFNMIPVPQPLI